MPRRGRRQQQPADGRAKPPDSRGALSETVKISVTAALEKFAHSVNETELDFPAEFTSAERAYIHKLCKQFGLQSKSSGFGDSRHLKVTRRQGTTVDESRQQASVRPEVLRVLNGLLRDFPEDEAGEKEHWHDVALSPSSASKPKHHLLGVMARGTKGIPARSRCPRDLQTFREQLPVWPRQQELLSLIAENQVILISGGTGCGKTTQIPQFILDSACAAQQRVRIICTQPRRLSAIGVAERVSSERGEALGHTVGYCIRLENSMSADTLLAFCTNGILLRTLMGDEDNLDSLTHIIVDEIHERDRFCDFLLISLRNLLRRRPDLRLILMSATMNTELFVDYFGGCPHAHVDGRTYDVSTVFLGDVLFHTGYQTPRMADVLAKQRLQSPSSSAAAATASGLSLSSTGQERLSRAVTGLATATAAMQTAAEERRHEKKTTTTATRDDVRDEFQDPAKYGDDDDETDDDDDIMELEERVIPYTEGDSDLEDETGHAAAASSLEDDRQALPTSATSQSQPTATGSAWQQANGTSATKSEEGMASAEDRIQHNRLLMAYQESFDDDRVDINLIVALIEKICREGAEGAVLVFLPGYDEIMGVGEQLERGRLASQLHVIMLHSMLQPAEQRKVFLAVPRGKRKVVLSTNIAETSITINDVVFVVDSGKVREKSYDSSAAVSTLQMGWVSKASALQRRGRAGRCQFGMCYHLMSQARFQGLAEHQEPELLRVPLQELCLHAKILAPDSSSIASFLAKAPDPPSVLALQRAVQDLKNAGALDHDENVTVLGGHLSSLALEPRLGKMLLYGVLFRCLDPVLTIACALSYRDPFVLPPKGQRVSALESRLQFAGGHLSDPLVIYNAYQEWVCRGVNSGAAMSFCRKNFLSYPTLQTVHGMRGQLLSQLRSAGFINANVDSKNLNLNSANTELVKAVLCAGFYPCVARKNPANKRLMTAKEPSVRLHQSSVLASAQISSFAASGKPHQPNAGAGFLDEDDDDDDDHKDEEWLVYEELTRVHASVSVKCCTAVSSLSLMLMAGSDAGKPPAASSPTATPISGAVESQAAGAYAATSTASPASVRVPAAAAAAAGIAGRLRGAESGGAIDTSSSSSSDMLVVDSWISFRLHPAAIHCLTVVRRKLRRAFLRLLASPKRKRSREDEAVVQAVTDSLSAGVDDELAAYEAAAARLSSQSQSRRGYGSRSPGVNQGGTAHHTMQAPRSRKPPAPHSTPSPGLWRGSQSGRGKESPLGLGKESPLGRGRVAKVAARLASSEVTGQGQNRVNGSGLGCRPSPQAAASGAERSSRRFQVPASADPTSRDAAGTGDGDRGDSPTQSGQAGGGDWKSALSTLAGGGGAGDALQATATSAPSPAPPAPAPGAAVAGAAVAGGVDRVGGRAQRGSLAGRGVLRQPTGPPGVAAAADAEYDAFPTGFCTAAVAASSPASHGEGDGIRPPDDGAPARQPAAPTAAVEGMATATRSDAAVAPDNDGTVPAAAAVTAVGASGSQSSRRHADRQRPLHTAAGAASGGAAAGASSAFNFTEFALMVGGGSAETDASQRPARSAVRQPRPGRNAGQRKQTAPTGDRPVSQSGSRASSSLASSPAVAPGLGVDPSQGGTTGSTAAGTDDVRKSRSGQSRQAASRAAKDAATQATANKTAAATSGNSCQPSQAAASAAAPVAFAAAGSGAAAASDKPVRKRAAGKAKGKPGNPAIVLAPVWSNPRR